MNYILSRASLIYRFIVLFWRIFAISHISAFDILTSYIRIRSLIFVEIIWDCSPAPRTVWLGRCSILACSACHVLGGSLGQRCCLGWLTTRSLLDEHSFCLLQFSAPGHAAADCPRSSVDKRRRGKAFARLEGFGVSS